jgi:hypothetical protein
MRGELHGGQSISSTEGKTRYRGVDLSRKGDAHLWRGRLVYGRGDSSTKGETFLWRGGLYLSNIYVIL